MLPPHVTKHGCYAKWCYLRGWKIEKKSHALTIYRNTKDYTKRSYEEADEDGVSLWPPGTEYKDVVSWPCFLSYWNRKFKCIKVRKKGADTCTDCLILRNEFRMSNNRRGGARPANDNRGGDHGEDEISSSSSNDSDNSDYVDEDDMERNITMMQQTLTKAKNHACAYQIQWQE